MNIFTGIFQSSAGEWSQARSEFIFKFGRGLYDKHIKPYAERGLPGYIFVAPNRVYSSWFMDRICKIHAAAIRETFDPPPEFIAVDPTYPPVVICEKCGTEVPEDASVYGGKYNLDVVCVMCVGDLEMEATEAFCQWMSENINQALEQTRLFWLEVSRIREERETVRL